MVDMEITTKGAKMKLNQAEQQALRSGRTITRKCRIKSTGEVLWVDVKRSWDTLYFSVDEGSWERTVTAAVTNRGA